MQRLPGAHRASSPPRGGPDPHKVRLTALIGVVAVMTVVPLAASAGPVGDGSSDGVAWGGDGGRADVRTSDAGDDRASGDVSGRDFGEASDAEGRTSEADSATGAGRAPEVGRVPGTDGVPEADGVLDGGDRAPVPSDDGSRSSLLLGLGPTAAARCGPELTSPDGIEAQSCVLTRGEETWARMYYRNTTGEELSAVLSFLAPDGRTVRMHCAVGAQNEPGACETPRERTRGEMGAYTAVAEFAASAGRGPLLLRSGSNSPRPTVG